MARDTSPQCKQCRREGQKLFLKGERCLTDKCGVERRSYPPGEHGRGRQKQSEYRVQLREKQKARRYYGVLEKQFRSYYDKASRQPGITGENLLTLLELRFDNVLVRLGFAASRRQGRQLIRHGHWLVNGRRVDIPSYQMRDGDVISVKQGTPAESDDPRRDGADGPDPRLAAGRSRHADGPRAAPPRAPRGRGPGAGAAHRRALLEVAAPFALPSPRDHRTRGPRKTRQSGPRCSTSKSPGSPVRRLTTSAARSSSSPSIAASATRSATRCVACCSPRSRGRRSRACASRGSRTSSRRSRASRRTSPTSS